MSKMRINTRGLGIVAGLVGMMSLALLMAGELLKFRNRANVAAYQEGFPEAQTDVVLFLGYFFVALLILFYRPRHRIGWLFMGVAFLMALSMFSRQYAVYGTLVAALPGATWMGWLQTWLFYLIFPAPLYILFLLFPDGRAPSRRWNLVIILGILSSMGMILGELIKSGQMVVFYGERVINLGVMNPTGSNAWMGISDVMNSIAWMIAVLLTPVVLFAPVWRYRSAKSVERKQLKWFVYFAVIALILSPLALIISGNTGELFLSTVLMILPVVTAIAILQHQLYDIDVIIKRTLLYGTLSAILAVVYFASVIIFQAIFALSSSQESDAAIVLSTLAIAVLFTPLRRRIQNALDKRFYRNKYNAEQALEKFAAAARDEVDLDKLTSALLMVVEETVKPSSSQVLIINKT